eukprot:4584440-Prymnesium_polylepis.1
MLDVTGSAVRQDGRSASLTAPNGQAQQVLLESALADAGLKAGDVQLTELHGTGTPLGDPIESRSLVDAVLRKRDGTCVPAIGGVKGNMGHTESNAGLTGLQKLLLVLQELHAAPNAQLRVINPHVASAFRKISCMRPVQ